MTEIAIIGDRFMLPDAFAAALRQVVGEQRRPAQPRAALAGRADGARLRRAGLEGLKEYQGEPDAIAEFIGEARSWSTTWHPITAGMLDRLPELKLIAVSRGGPVNIDMAAARERGVLVVNTPGRNASAVAEFTIAAILAETRLIRAGHEALRQGDWRGDLYRADLTGTEFSELTVGLIGYGLIGTRVVPLLKPFGCRILVCDPYQELSPEDAADGVVMTDLDTLLAESDVVSLHARVTDETKGFLAAAQFARDEARQPTSSTRRAGRWSTTTICTAALETRPHPRRHARDLLAGADAPRRAAAEARQCHADAAHRRRLDHHGPHRRADGGRGGPPLAGGRAAAQPMLNGEAP